MKIETNQNTVFKPIELKITIESKEELASLIAAVNASRVSLLENCPTYMETKLINTDLNHELYNTLKSFYK